MHSYLHEGDTLIDTSLICFVCQKFVFLQLFLLFSLFSFWIYRKVAFLFEYSSVHRKTLVGKHWLFYINTIKKRHTFILPPVSCLMWEESLYVSYTHTHHTSIPSVQEILCNYLIWLIEFHSLGNQFNIENHLSVPRLLTVCPICNNKNHISKRNEVKKKRKNALFSVSVRCCIICVYCIVSMYCIALCSQKPPPSLLHKISCANCCDWQQQ